MAPERWVLLFVAFLAIFCGKIKCDECDSKEGCGDCVSIATCAWCVSTTSSNYCFNATSNPAGCQSDDADKILRSEESKTVIIDSYPLWFESQPEDRKMQIRPQHIKHTHKMALDQTGTFSFEFEYSIADNPLDIYYLVDITTFTPRDGGDLVRLARRLANTMSKKSQNVRIGFGVINPAEDNTGGNPRFLHLMNLSDDIAYFIELVQNMTIATTTKGQSGNFDLVSQAVVCDSIGWRSQSRRILIVSTGAAAAFAEPSPSSSSFLSDVDCQLDKSGYYERSYATSQVSFAELQQSAKQHSVGLVVALPSKMYREYRTQNSSANVVEIVKHDYETIKGRIQMKHNASSEIEIRFYTSCNAESPKLIEEHRRSTCRNVKIPDKVRFRAQVLLPPLSYDLESHQVVKIYAEGFDDQLLLMELNVTYRRPCEDVEEQGGGALEAGHCGDKFTCFNPADGSLCGGVGECECGTCRCPGADFAGEFCECDNGRCRSEDGQVCSGHGDCDCGACRCSSGYSGEHCETCLDCFDKCDTFKDCIDCQIFSDGNYNIVQCSLYCSEMKIESAEVIEREDRKTYCQYSNDNGCTYTANYWTSNDGTHIEVIEERQCPTTEAPKGFFDLFS